MSSFFTTDNLWNRILTKVFDLCLLNLLTFLCCVPIVTAGASLTAMYAVMMKMAKNQEGPIIKSFMKEFKSNIRGSFGGWLLILAGFILLLVDLALWTQNEVEYRSLFYGLTIAMVLALCAFADWYFAIRARFVETSGSALKNAARFELVYLPVSVLMGAYTVGMVFLLLHFPMFAALVPLAGLALLEYPKAVYIRGKFDRYIEEKELDIPVEEEEEETGAVKGLKGREKEAVTDKKGKKEAKEDETAESFGWKQRFWLWKKTETEKMAGMTGREKWDYILTYYRAWLLTLVLVIAAAAGTAWHFAFNNAKCGFSCALVNGFMEKGDTVFSEELDDYFGFQPRKEYAYFDTEYQIAYPGVDNEAADTSFYEKFFLNIRTGSLDVAIVPESFLEYCNTVERVFYDVTEVLDEEQRKAWEPYFVTGKDEEGNEYICGIDISHLKFLEEEDITFVNGNAGESAILTFPCNSEHKEKCQEFLELFEQYENEK